MRDIEIFSRASGLARNCSSPVLMVSEDDDYDSIPSSGPVKLSNKVPVPFPSIEAPVEQLDGTVRPCIETPWIRERPTGVIAMFISEECH